MEYCIDGEISLIISRSIIPKLQALIRMENQ